MSVSDSPTVVHLRERAAADAERPERWDPQTDDAIEGTVERILDLVSDNGPFQVLTLRTERGLVDVNCGRAALRNAVAEQSPQEGDHVAILYVGPRVSSTGRTYYDYRMATTPAESF